MSPHPMVLVASHERSGTHFLIDALRLNLKQTRFPFLRPSFPALENLLLPHDEHVFEGLRAHAFDSGGSIPIFKTHLLRSEIEAALNLEGMLTGAEKDLLEYVYRNSKQLYIHRDGRDVLVSLYHYMRQGGGLHADVKSRLEKMTFSAFMRTPNSHVHMVRSFQDFDANLVTYWLRHIQEWTAADEVIPVAYEELHQNFEQTVRQIAQQLRLGSSLAEPVRPVSLRHDQRYPIVARIAKRLRLPDLLPRLVTSTAVLPRKGIVGDWESHFSEEDLNFFEATVKDQTVGLLGSVRGPRRDTDG